MGIGQTILDILSYLFWLRSRGVNEPESERIGVDVVIHTTHKWALKLGSRFIASCALLAFFLCFVFTHSVYFSLFVSLDCFDSRILNPVDGRTFDDPSQSASQRAQVGSCSTLIVFGARRGRCRRLSKWNKENSVHRKEHTACCSSSSVGQWVLLWGCGYQLSLCVSVTVSWDSACIGVFVVPLYYSYSSIAESVK